MTGHSTPSLSRLGGVLPLLVLCAVVSAGASAAVQPGARGAGTGDAQGDGLPIRNDPPGLVFAQQPAILILIDGDPVYRPVEGTNLQRVINTKPFIVRDSAGIHYLKIFDGWMEAYSLTGLWSVAGVPPPRAPQALQQTVAATSVDLLDRAVPGMPGEAPTLDVSAAPAIYISTKPAELIVTDGAPRFVPVEGLSLEYLENTTANVFKEPTDDELYVLSAGRWFRAWRTDGPWQVVPRSELPADIAAIPDSSPVWHGNHAVRVQSGGDDGRSGGRGR